MITEDHLEQLALTWFQETGWSYVPGPTLAHDGPAPERADYAGVVLKPRLAAAVAALNPQLPHAAVEEVVHLATTPDHPSLIQSNRHFHRLLLQGVSVTFTNAAGDKETDHAQLIDFGNPDRNDLVVVNQFTIQGTKKARRPDVVVFVNGLPLAVLELKNIADAHADIWNAFRQLQTYKAEIDDLFVYNAALVISDGVQARVGALTAASEWFMPWRTIADADDRPTLEFELEKIVRGFFRPDLFLDYVRHFVLFEQDGDAIVKKIAGYHQFHGVREAVAATLVAAQGPETDVVREKRATYADEVEPGSKKAGVFWHTQGSGKSISMAMYAGKLLQQPGMNNPTLVVVTDRNDLDGQLFGQFSAARMLLRQAPEQADSREELRAKLAERQSGGIIFTTVQKFSLLEGEQAHPVLCGRHNVVVISDEAHRSQYGLKPRLDIKTGQYVYGYAKHLRDALPQASFIGFTGTPIALEDKDTRAVFGDYVSIYDIQDAVDDQATVQIYYESRLAKLDLNRAAIEQLNDDVEDVIEDEEDLGAREGTKSKWAELSKLVGATPRLEQLAADLVEHYETRTRSVEGKAMFVGMSRDICVAMFDEIIKLRPDWAGTRLTKDGKDVRNGGYNPEDGAIRIVMTGNATDRAAIQAHVFSKAQKKRLAKRFKDPGDPLRIVIVRDMWLTGFDAPCCHTMYIDKPMSGHNLMQAIARVNRVFKDKPGGLVVDYIGIASELKKALRTYTDAKGRGQPTVHAEDGLAILKEKLDIVRTLLHGFDYTAFETAPMTLLVPATQHLLAQENGKKRFMDATAAITKAYALCATLDEAAELRTEIAFYNALRSIIIKHTTVDKKLVDDDKNTALKQILDNAVIAEGIDDIFTLAGVERPNIGLLSDEFLEDVKAMPAQNLAVELLGRLLRDQVKSGSRSNVVQEKKFGDRLAATLLKYNNRAVEASQIIQELVDMAKDIKAALKRNEELGLNPDEIAFYDALADRPEVLVHMGNENLRKLAVELTEKLRNSTTVDWQVRENVRAKMRLLIKRLLRKYKYPPKGQEAAVALVLEQAQALADEWTS